MFNRMFNRGMDYSWVDYRTDTETEMSVIFILLFSVILVKGVFLCQIGIFGITMCKVMETVIKVQLLQFLTSRGLFASNSIC
jgi:hypothetical protein